VSPRWSCRNTKPATTQDMATRARHRWPASFRRYAPRVARAICALGPWAVLLDASMRRGAMVLSVSATTGASGELRVDRVEYDGEHGKVCSGRRRRRLRRASRCTATILRVYYAQIAQGLAHNAPTVGCGNRARGRAQKSQVTLRHFSALLVRCKCKNGSSSGVRQCWDPSGGA